MDKEIKDGLVEDEQVDKERSFLMTSQRSENKTKCSFHFAFADVHLLFPIYHYCLVALEESWLAVCDLLFMSFLTNPAVLSYCCAT